MHAYLITVLRQSFAARNDSQYGAINRFEARAAIRGLRAERDGRAAALRAQYMA